MFTWLSKASAPAVTGEPSPLLTHLAAAFAPRIAGLWPAPHALFLTATCERRHLVCLALSLAPLTHEVAEGVLHWPLRRAIKTILPTGLPGLGRALARMGETAWEEVDYGRLLTVLADVDAAKVARHAQTLTPTLISGLSLMPSALLRTGLGRLNLNDGQADLVREAWQAIVVRFGEGVAGRLAQRWSRALTPQVLADRIRDDLLPELPPTPLPGHPRLRHLATKSAMREVAQRFHNCLAGQVPFAAEGRSIYFEWLGEPGAVVEVTRDRLWGWVLEEAKAKDNQPVMEPARGEICTALREIGVHVGRTYWDIDRALGIVLQDGRSARSEADIVGSLFGD